MCVLGENKQQSEKTWEGFSRLLLYRTRSCERQSLCRWADPADRVATVKPKGQVLINVIAYLSCSVVFHVVTACFLGHAARAALGLDRSGRDRIVTFSLLISQPLSGRGGIIAAVVTPENFTIQDYDIYSFPSDLTAILALPLTTP